MCLRQVSLQKQKVNIYTSTNWTMHFFPWKCSNFRWDGHCGHEGVSRTPAVAGLPAPHGKPAIEVCVPITPAFKMGEWIVKDPTICGYGKA